MKYSGIEQTNLINSEKPVLILIQGIPGSGKSTLAKHLADINRINYYEADNWFMINGEYKFNKNELKDAHRFCQLCAKNDLRQGKHCIVSNTSLSDNELKPYYDWSKEGLCNIFLIRKETNYGSIHNVPEDCIERMKEKLKGCTYKPDLIIK